MTNIEIFGVQGYLSNTIKLRLDTALTDLGIPYQIAEVREIEKFISEGLERVPAIRVDHKKLFSIANNGTGAEPVISAVLDYIFEEKMKTLLVPIDFSDHSLHAARWAIAMADLLHLKVNLLHVHRPVIDPYNTEMLNSGEIIQNVQNELTGVCERLKAEPEAVKIGSHVQSSLVIGDPLLEIIRQTKDASAALVVMGTLGTSNVLRKVFGTISTTVSRHARKPVFLIPPGVHFKKPEKILIAFNEDLLKGSALDQLCDLNKAFGAHLEFVHVRDSEMPFEEIRDQLVDRLVKPDAQPEFSLDVREIEPQKSKNVLPALMEYAQRTNPDVVVFVARHRSMIYRLFNVSLSARATFETQWPLLVLSAAAGGAE